VAANVDVAAVVPDAAENVTLTPLCQFPLSNVRDVGDAVTAVLPERVRFTVTLPEGAAFKRIVDVLLAPPAMVSDVGLATIAGWTVP
jgi:hypothetical protein